MNTAVASRAQVVGRALSSWRRGNEHFDTAAQAAAEGLGYAAADVICQLENVALVRCSPDALSRALERELGGETWSAPNEVLHLAAATVPGLVIESIATALVLGARSQVRRSTRECVLDPFVDFLRDEAPEFAQAIHIADDVAWDSPNAAIVYGTDDTIALVRERLPHARIAGYGSREGVAVIAPGTPEGWAADLAADILTVLQRGCRSPSHVFVMDDAASATDALHEELRRALPRHAHDSPLPQRAASDAVALSTITVAEAERHIEIGNVAVRVVTCTDRADLQRQVRQLGSKLQTAILAADEDRTGLTDLLTDAGCTRVAAPGEAHSPAADWPQDGIGRFAPLVLA